MPPNTHRTIIEEKAFSRQIEGLAISHRRLDEVMVGISVALSSRPEHCTVVPGTKLSVIKTQAYPKAPALRIFFTYDENDVHLQFVEFAEPDQEANNTVTV